MKTTILLKTGLSLLIFSFLTACIETEIVPETLEPTLTLSPKNTVLNVNDMAQLQATYTDPANMDRSDLINWRSNNAEVASVSREGLVNALAAGQTWIVAEVPGVLADSTLVTVLDNMSAVASVIVSAPATSLEQDETLQFSAEVLDRDGNAITDQAVTWQSSDPDILSIDANGLATGIAPGMVQVVATAEAVGSAPYAVEVTPAGGASRSGNFQGANSYSARGTATLSAMSGSLELAFSEDFQSSNGPGLRVYLANSGSSVLTSQNSVSLGNLKSTRGAQMYDVPSSIGINDFNFVVIYCEPFNIPFGFARLD